MALNFNSVFYQIFPSGEDALAIRFGGACLWLASEIFREDPATGNHAERLAWASEMFDKAKSKAERKEIVLDKGAEIRFRAFGVDLIDESIDDQTIADYTAKYLDVILGGK